MVCRCGDVDIRRTTHGGAWFLASSPLFLQNFTLPFFQYAPVDVIWGPLWFVAALVQLQVLMFAVRRQIVRQPLAVTIIAAVVIGLAFRALVSIGFGAREGELDSGLAGALYCLPFTHIEAITLGCLVGRGSLRGLGPLLWPLTMITAVTGLVAGPLLAHSVAFTSFGLDFPLRSNYMHVWMYSMLALVAAALCSPNNPLAVWVRSRQPGRRVDEGLSRLSELSFGAYVFHGAIMASGMNLAPWLRAKGFHPAAPIVIVMTLVESLILAQFVLSARRAVGARIDLRSRVARSPTIQSAEI